MLSGQAQKSVFSCIISCSLKVYKLPTSFLNSFYRLSERVFSSVFHNVKVRRCKRSKGSSGVKRNPPASFVLFTKYIKKSYFFRFELPLNHSSSHYHIDLWLMSWKLLSSLLAQQLTNQREIWILTMSFRRHVTGGSISFPYGALRMATSWPPQRDENKGKCILKQRPSRNPHNSCCLWCKYFREVRWPHSVAKAINNHKKYEPPSPWLIACVLHNALFAVSFKQFTISRPNCQSNQGYFKVIFACVSLDTLQLSP